MRKRKNMKKSIDLEVNVKIDKSVMEEMIQSLVRMFKVKSVCQEEGGHCCTSMATSKSKEVTDTDTGIDTEDADNDTTEGTEGEIEGTQRSLFWQVVADRG